MIDVPNISDHGLIGDLQTAALVDVNGTIDWFCCPRFDAPSVFASLLDSERGGFFRIAPDGTDYVTRQLYLPETAILVTRFMSEGGVGEVVDFMPVAEGPATDRHRIVRLVRVVRGTMRFVAEIEPRFDYARQVAPRRGHGRRRRVRVGRHVAHDAPGGHSGAARRGTGGEGRTNGTGHSHHDAAERG